MKLNVFLNTYGIRRFVGILAEENKRIFFEYSPEFLQSGIELSPFQLPLSSGIFEDKKRIFDGLFGLFNDSLPDGWGCLLLDRMLRKRGLAYDQITPLARLSMVGCNPMGALEYEPAEDLADALGNIELDSLSGEIGEVLAGDNSIILDELLKLNGSSGGARPKIAALVSEDKTQIIHGAPTLPDGFSPWIIKFSESMDGKDSGAIEYIYSLIAKQAGVEMPETFLFPSQTCSGFFGVKRFDRNGAQKVHMHTACGLLHASHRYSSIDYGNLLRLTMQLTRNKAEVTKMARLMIFNVKAGNRDDHSKNFSFLLTEDNEWKLAPAYDLTPSAGIMGEQTSMVNGKGTDITDADLIAAAQTVEIPERKTREMICEVNDAVAMFPELKKEYGLKS
jgi:serine/threonine-protein kinase HipA